MRRCLTHVRFLVLYLEWAKVFFNGHACEHAINTYRFCALSVCCIRSSMYSSVYVKKAGWLAACWTTGCCCWCRREERNTNILYTLVYLYQVDRRWADPAVEAHRQRVAGNQCGLSFYATYVAVAVDVCYIRYTSRRVECAYLFGNKTRNLWIVCPIPLSCSPPRSPSSSKTRRTGAFNKPSSRDAHTKGMSMRVLYGLR